MILIPGESVPESGLGDRIAGCCGRQDAARHAVQDRTRPDLRAALYSAKAAPAGRVWAGSMSFSLA